MRNSVTLLAETLFASREPALADALVNEMLYVLTESGMVGDEVYDGIANIMANPSDSNFDFTEMTDEDQLEFILYDIANNWVELNEDSTVELGPELGKSLLTERFFSREE